MLHERATVLRYTYITYRVVDFPNYSRHVGIIRNITSQPLLSASLCTR